jgi:hypothetical protein
MTPYEARYHVGSEVRISSPEKLQLFQREWKYHHKLTDEQLEYGNRLAEVESVGFYHGGDVLYKLLAIPGIWHEDCLNSTEPES